MRFPGTITVSDDAFEKTLESAANSFKLHGFTNIVFLGDHGGYQNDIKRVVARLNKTWVDSGARAFVPPEYYGTSSDGYAQILREHGYRDDGIGTHAGLADTSLLLAVAPQMVRLERLRNGAKLGAADGVYGGDPHRASAELGQLGIDAIVLRTITAIRNETAAVEGFASIPLPPFCTAPPANGRKSPCICVPVVCRASDRLLSARWPV